MALSETVNTSIVSPPAQTSRQTSRQNWRSRPVVKSKTQLLQIETPSQYTARKLWQLKQTYSRLQRERKPSEFEYYRRNRIDAWWLSSHDPKCYKVYPKGVQKYTYGKWQPPITYDVEILYDWYHSLHKALELTAEPIKAGLIFLMKGSGFIFKDVVYDCTALYDKIQIILDRDNNKITKLSHVLEYLRDPVIPRDKFLAHIGFSSMRRYIEFELRRANAR